ncbi:MAG: hypothetical protein JWO81_3350 [Alphaproteobacteria bacterium]|nr:hypothetical protein [Alphaproteobacteria bacterium]
MRVTYRHLFFALAAAAGFAGSAASAEDAPAPPPVFTIAGGATLVTDYRFRGISQTDRNVAVQGTATLSHSSGFYVTFWGSSVDDYVTASGQSHQELDLIGGYKKTVGHTTIDLGVLYYVYPKTRLAGDRTSSNFFEPYFDVSQTFGPVTAKATINYAPKQKALALDQIGPKRDNVYLAGDLSAAIPHAPIGLTGHLGLTFGPSWLCIGKGYTEWGVGATLSYHQLTFGVQYVDTNGTFITPTGKNASKAGIVGSVGVAF